MVPLGTLCLRPWSAPKGLLKERLHQVQVPSTWEPAGSRDRLPLHQRCISFLMGRTVFPLFLEAEYRPPAELHSQGCRRPFREGLRPEPMEPRVKHSPPRTQDLDRRPVRWRTEVPALATPGGVKITWKRSPCLQSCKAKMGLVGLSPPRSIWGVVSSVYFASNDFLVWTVREIQSDTFR